MTDETTTPDEALEEAPAPGQLGTAGGHDARLLEVNGFTAIRQAVLTHVQALADIPLEVMDAALAYNRDGMARLELDTSPQAPEALRLARRQHAHLEAARRFRRDLKNLAETLAARDRLTAR